jgi:hypothetical protein
MLYNYIQVSNNYYKMEQEQPQEYDNIFTYLLSFVVLIFTFVYNNFAYIFGIIIIMFGILVYMKMTKIDLSSQPMSRSKTVIIEGMTTDSSDNAGLENDLITPPITADLETKLKSGFCKMHASKNSPMTELDSECGVFQKSSCLNTDCCGWAVTSDNPDGKCRAGDKSGITFKYDDADKKIDIDCYYYKGNAGTGSKCLE